MPTPVIESLRHLRNAGVFADIPTGGFPHTFKAYNLVYGFNGCGKTTLSRLIESLGDRGVSTNLADGAEFSFRLSDGSTPSHATPKTVASRYVAVFSEDYVDRTLAWKDGTARPIIYLGEEQAGLAKLLTKLETEETAASQNEVLKNSEWSYAQRALDTKARDVARLIAEELGLGRRYNAANLKADYASRKYTPAEKIGDDERRRLKEVINRTDLPSTLPKVCLPSSAAETRSAVEKVLRISVAEVAIVALERRKDALSWVRQGLEIHQNEPECLFCGSALQASRIQALEAALKSGFDALSAAIGEADNYVERFRHSCLTSKEELLGLDVTLTGFKDEFGQYKTDLLSLLDDGVASAAKWHSQLAKKKAEPDQKLEACTVSDGDWDLSLKAKTDKLNELIDSNNTAIKNFSSEQSRAKEKLMNHHLSDHQTAYGETVEAEKATAAARATSANVLAEIRTKIAKIREQLRSHGPAAAELNKLLKSYLGHEHISLEAVDDGYRICRDGKVSRKPLSEGEKTAVAFCYFLTSLKAEGRRLADLIVVLDDPISSLDARAMTHVVALVRKHFSAVTQLFILTHNLEFMREMKKWLSKRYEKETAEFLFIETGLDNRGRRSSAIVKMPRLIRDYESEYHYLYSLVKFLADEPDDAEKFAYLMPNAIRKVLDIFLAFKDPGASGLEPKVDKLIQDYPDLDAARVKAMERLAQLESHSESIGDVITFSAYTLAQVADAAKCLLEVIEAVDSKHKRAMDRLCRP